MCVRVIDLEIWHRGAGNDVVGGEGEREGCSREMYSGWVRFDARIQVGIGGGRGRRVGCFGSVVCLDVPQVVMAILDPSLLFRISESWALLLTAKVVVVGRVGRSSLRKCSLFSMSFFQLGRRTGRCR